MPKIRVDSLCRYSKAGSKMSFLDESDFDVSGSPELPVGGSRQTANFSLSGGRYGSSGEECCYSHPEGAWKKRINFVHLS